MNVRIFWVRAMKCMCAQTRPRFILSSEGVFGGMEFEPMLTPREKSPLPEKVPRGGSNPRRCGQRAQALPTELFRPPAMVIKRVSPGQNLLQTYWKRISAPAILAPVCAHALCQPCLPGCQSPRCSPPVRRLLSLLLAPASMTLSAHPFPEKMTHHQGSVTH